MTVQFLSLKKDTPHRGYWDMALLENLFEGFTKAEVDSVLKGDFSIVVIPARHHADMVYEINKELSKLKSVILFLMGDEEADFPVEEIKHDNIKIWVQNPKPGRHENYTRLGCGYTPGTKIATKLPEKKHDWFFSGQVTHERRELCVEQLQTMKNGILNKTKSFTAGMPPEEYSYYMSEAKVAPCPSGPQTPDTFRLFEALELGCVPIADTQTPKEDWEGFWEWLFHLDDSIPFTRIKDWTDLPGYTKDLVDLYPVINNLVQSWWLRYKSKLVNKIYHDIEHLTGKDYKDPVTVVIPISPIKSHPETHILEETIESVRHHLPDSEIILMFDGVRQEQSDMRADYQEHIRRVLWKCREWGNITPFIFDEHKHQSGMMKYIIDEIKTPLLLFIEQDTPLVTDEPIEWDLLKESILSGKSNVIRLYHEGQIPREHKHLMIGEPENNLLATYQWSSRPHISSKAFYRRMLSENFSDKANCFIEDLIHSKLMTAYQQDKKLGWDQWRVHIYYPNEKNLKRSYHTDGRQGAEKYETLQEW